MGSYSAGPLVRVAHEDQPHAARRGSQCAASYLTVYPPGAARGVAPIADPYTKLEDTTKDRTA